MAGRILNRRELRKQADQAEQTVTVASDPATALVAPKRGAKKAAATPKVKKSRKKAPVRLCARWGVFDAGMKQIAIFDYNKRAAADQKIAELTAKKNGVFFLQIVKEPMPEPVLAEAPSGE